VFVLSRYKFVSKLMAGRQNVLEIGCADAFGTRIVRQAVPKVTATDIDPIFIEDCRARDEGDGKLADLLEQVAQAAGGRPA
jgi:16S rRNA A1518/A1519 N6-dimethyltransferase RsmA/KsgA/DIM1 with predicted DNA glycosylase/AP lyase activity